MPRREIEVPFGRLLQALGVQAGPRLALSDELVPTGPLLEMRHFGDPVGAVLCMASGATTAVAGQKGHFWITRETARKVIPVAAWYAAVSAIQIVPPGTALDADTPALSRVPQNMRGTDYTPVSRLHSNTTATVITGLGFLHSDPVGAGVVPIADFAPLWYAHVLGGGNGGQPGFHIVNSTNNETTTVAMAWIEVP